jgi:hypothetical protein
MSCLPQSSYKSSLLLYDDAQSIYRKSRGLDFSLSSVGTKAAGRTSILRLNYRNTREILQFACDFASKFMDAKAADDDHIPMVHPESGGMSGPGPAAPRCRSWMEDGRLKINDGALHPNGVKHTSPGQRPGFRNRKRTRACPARSSFQALKSCVLCP